MLQAPVLPGAVPRQAQTPCLHPAAVLPWALHAKGPGAGSRELSHLPWALPGGASSWCWVRSCNSFTLFFFFLSFSPSSPCALCFVVFFFGHPHQVFLLNSSLLPHPAPTQPMTTSCFGYVQNLARQVLPVVLEVPAREVNLLPANWGHVCV